MSQESIMVSGESHFRYYKTKYILYLGYQDGFFKIVRCWNEDKQVDIPVESKLYRNYHEAEIDVQKQIDIWLKSLS